MTLQIWEKDNFFSILQFKRTFFYHSETTYIKGLSSLHRFRPSLGIIRDI